MGYCINVQNSNFSIRRENLDSALAALKGLLDPAILYHNASGGTYSQGGRIPHYAFVNMDSFQRAHTLQDALQAWRWELVVQEEVSEKGGDVTGIFFLSEKLGDDLFLFETLAPFIEEGSFIDFVGEDNAMWRWLFKEQKLVEQQGHVTYS